MRNYDQVTMPDPGIRAKAFDVRDFSSYLLPGPCHPSVSFAVVHNRSHLEVREFPSDLAQIM